MQRAFNKMCLALVLLLGFMAVMVDSTSYLLSFLGDLFFVGAIVAVVWLVLTKPAEEER